MRISPEFSEVAGKPEAAPRLSDHTASLAWTVLKINKTLGNKNRGGQDRYPTTNEYRMLRISSILRSSLKSNMPTIVHEIHAGNGADKLILTILDEPGVPLDGRLYKSTSGSLTRLRLTREIIGEFNDLIDHA